MAKIQKHKALAIHTKKQQQVLSVLESAAKQLGLKVSQGKLQYRGLRLKGGNCLFKGEKWLVIDKTQPFEELVEIYRQALSPEELAAADLPVESRTLLSPYFLSVMPAPEEILTEKAA